MRVYCRILSLVLMFLVLQGGVFFVHGLGGPLLTAVKGSSIVVDGVINGPEWLDSQHVRFSWAYNNSSLVNSGELWLKNNGTHLEFAFAFNGTAQLNSGNDIYENQVTLLFDHNNNGIVDNFDSLKGYMVNYVVGGYFWNYFDSHYNATMNFYEWDQQVDGQGKMVHSNPGGMGRFSAEFSMPLFSTVPQDLAIPVNGTIGFELLFQQVHLNGFNIVSMGEACWPAAPPNCKVPTSSSDLPPPQANGWATIVRSDDGVINDTTPPTINNPGIQPALPTSADNVLVSSLVRDDLSGVKNASLIYTTDNWGTVNRTLSMSVNQTSHQATVTIPVQQTSVRVQYYLVAYDYAGNKALNDNGTSYFHYDVRPPPPPPPSTQPMVSDPVFVPVAPGPGDVVTISVTVTDTQASVSSVQVFYTVDNWRSNTTTAMLYDTMSYVARGQIMSFPAGTHVQYYIVARDSLGHKSIKNNGGNYYSYDVSSGSLTGQPEFSATSSFLLIATGLAALAFFTLFLLAHLRKKARNPMGAKKT